MHVCVCAVGMMVGCYHVVQLSQDMAPTAEEWVWVAVCCMLAAIYEATTTQNDNLFLPLVFMTLLLC